MAANYHASYIVRNPWGGYPLGRLKGKRSKQFLENECNEIFKLMIDGASDKEIQQTQNLPERTFFKSRLAAKLYNQNINIRNDQILFYKEVTKERLLDDKRIFQAE